MPTKTKEINEKNNKKTNKVATTKTTVKPKTSSKGTAKKKDTAKKGNYQKQQISDHACPKHDRHLYGQPFFKIVDCFSIQWYNLCPTPF